MDMKGTLFPQIFARPLRQKIKNNTKLMTYLIFLREIAIILKFCFLHFFKKKFDFFRSTSMIPMSCQNKNMKQIIQGISDRIN